MRPSAELIDQHLTEAARTALRDLCELFATMAWEQAPPPPGPDYRDVPAPGPQPSMPGAADAAWTRASATPPAVDLDTIEVPAAP